MNVTSKSAPGTGSRQLITPFLWFDHQAEEAARHYIAIFPESRVVTVTHYEEAAAQASGRPTGSVMTVVFELAGQRFTALNGGPHFKFTEAVSFVVNCDTAEELDAYWDKLSAGGEPGQCGWLKDRFGLSWQVVPANLGELLQDADVERSHRVMQAILGMSKLDIRVLRRAYDGR